MGERERRDSRKVREGKPILDIKRWRILDYFLYPYRAWKEKKRQEALRQQILDSISSETEIGYKGSDNEEVQ